jgi:hypothetical protein
MPTDGRHRVTDHRGRRRRAARAAPGGPGGRWVPILLSVFGAGSIGGGLFHPDPSNGFPPGSSAGASAVTSWHGVLHMVCGSLAFLSLIAACFVLAHGLSVALIWVAMAGALVNADFGRLRG